MITLATVLAVIAIVVGLAGIIIPILPGVFLIWAAVILWTFAVSVDPWWVPVVAASAVYALGLLSQALIPGRRMQRAGIPNSTLVIGVIAAVIGFFVIPVIGFAIGFVVGVWLAEVARVGAAASRASTVHALKAAVLSYGIELLTGLVLAVGWAVFAWRTLTP